MKDMKRALRRHHRRRMFARACRILSRNTENHPDDPEIRARAGRWYNNLQKCSCYMCGHRRKWGGPTTQERRFNATDALKQYQQSIHEGQSIESPD